MKLKIIRQCEIGFDDYCKIFYKKSPRRLSKGDHAEARYEYFKFVSFLYLKGAFE